MQHSLSLLHRSAVMLPCICSRKYGSCTGPAVAVTYRHASTDASTSTTTTTASSPHLSSSVAGGMHVDPRLLPNSIPGMSQEELAARITAFHSARSTQERAASAKNIADDIELMRRSLPPKDFAAYLQRIEAEQLVMAKEEAAMASMTPLQLHQYQMKKRRQLVRQEWYKTFLLLAAIIGSTFFLFSLFIFFY